MENFIAVKDIPSDRSLKRWYAAYRRKYFSNDLPPASEVQMYYFPLPGLHGNCEDEFFAEREEYVIRINSAWEKLEDMSRIILLHEMAHLHLWPYELHGERFQNEMKRLAGAGAFRRLW